MANTSNLEGASLSRHHSFHSSEEEAPLYHSCGNEWRPLCREQSYLRQLQPEASFPWFHQRSLTNRALWAISGPCGNTGKGKWTCVPSGRTSFLHWGRSSFPKCAFLGKYPLYCCVSFVRHMLGGKQRQVSFSVPQGWSRAWRHHTGLPAESTTAEMSRVTGSKLSSVPSPRRDSHLWLLFHLLGRSNLRASSGCSLTSHAHQLGGQSWKCPVAQHG